jgi:hypothetical protein
MTRKFFLFLAAILPAYLSAQFYNGSQTDFGKNRVQYQDFKWQYMRFEKYEVYYSIGGRELAVYTARAAKTHIAEIEKFLDFTLDERIQFVVYNKLEDFKQSNAGLLNDDGSNVGGMTRIVGRKVFIYYEGDHVKLEQQIRAGIAEIMINQMMYGGNMRDMVKNSTLLALPEWYIKGLVSYISIGWNTDIDNRVRDGILSGRYRKFNHLTGEDAAYAGHSIWYCIAEKYSPAVIPNILYMTKVSRNVESAFLFVLGVNMRILTIEWQNYFSEKYSMNDTTRTMPTAKPILEKPKSSRVYSQAKVSPDGKYVAYVSNELGQVKIWLQDLATGSKKRIFKRGQKLDRINDYSYPLIAWHPTGSILSWIYEKEGETWLNFYTVEDGERIEKPIFNFIKIIDYSYSPNGQQLVMSAVMRGQTDIFVYNIAGGGQVQITNDVYDDLNPRFVNGGKNIIFSSNREGDTLKSVDPDVHLPKYFDLWLYDWANKSNVLRRVTNTPLINELQAQPWDSTHFSYLSDKNGIKNRYVGYFDSAVAYVDTGLHYRYFATSIPVTNYKFGILEQEIAPAAKMLSQILYHDGRYYIYTESMPAFGELTSTKQKNTTYRERVYEITKIEREIDSLEQVKRLDATQKPPTPIVADPVPAPKDSGKIDIRNYEFDGNQPKQQFNVPPPPVVKKDDTASNDSAQAAKNEFLLPIVRNYKIQYSTEYVISQLDNSYLNAGYQRFTGGGAPIYLNPGFTGLFKIGMTDMLEDHKLVGGVRLSGDINNNEYVIYYEDRTKRWDKSIMLHRQSLPALNPNNPSRIHTHEGRYGLKYPFNEVLSVRGYFGYRNDQRVFLSTDLISLNKKNQYNNSANVKFELVFDNTIKRGLNLYNGMRFKVFFESFQGLDSVFQAKVEKNKWFKNDLYIVGFDFRHYQKVHREIIWANRVSWATSFGHEKLVYYMGAVDNWLMPKFDASVQVATDQNYTYQTLATPMRGFWQNIRNGNSFAMINSELRVPLFRYLFNRPLRSDFINNFQVIGFGDIGTAWTGKSPYDPSNSLNSQVISSPGNPITVILNSHREPIVGGYGIGLRTRLWGYFIRLDWAWGVENGMVQPRVTYLSFSYDF